MTRTTAKQTVHFSTFRLTYTALVAIVEAAELSAHSCPRCKQERCHLKNLQSPGPCSQHPAPGNMVENWEGFSSPTRPCYSVQSPRSPIQVPTAAARWKVTARYGQDRLSC